MKSFDFRSSEELMSHRQNLALSLIDIDAIVVLKEKRYGNGNSKNPGNCGHNPRSRRSAGAIR